MSENELHTLSEEDLQAVSGGYILETVTSEGTRYAVYGDHDATVLGFAKSLDEAKKLAAEHNVSSKVITKFENSKNLSL